MVKINASGVCPTDEFTCSGADPEGLLPSIIGHVWRGTAFGGARGRTDVPRIVDWYMDGRIDINSQFTHVIPVDRINQAFDLTHLGASTRSVVTFGWP